MTEKNKLKISSLAKDVLFDEPIQLSVSEEMPTYLLTHPLQRRSFR